MEASTSGHCNTDQPDTDEEDTAADNSDRLAGRGEFESLVRSHQERRRDSESMARSFAAALFATFGALLSYPFAKGFEAESVDDARAWFALAATLVLLGISFVMLSRVWVSIGRDARVSRARWFARNPKVARRLRITGGVAAVAVALAVLLALDQPIQQEIALGAAALGMMTYTVFALFAKPEVLDDEDIAIEYANADVGELRLAIATLESSIEARLELSNEKLLERIDALATQVDNQASGSLRHRWTRLVARLWRQRRVRG